MSEFEEEEGAGPSLAIPPLYVLRSAAVCPRCGQAVQVHALGCAAFQDAEESAIIEEFHFLHFVRSVPETLLGILKDKCAGLFFDQPEPGDDLYLMNHCRCGAILDDTELHGDVGSAFWPDTPDGFRRLRLFRLPAEEPVEIDASYSLGGGEYLDFVKADPW